MNLYAIETSDGNRYVLSDDDCDQMVTWACSRRLLHHDFNSVLKSTGRATQINIDAKGGTTTWLFGDEEWSARVIEIDANSLKPSEKIWNFHLNFTIPASFYQKEGV